MLTESVLKSSDEEGGECTAVAPQAAQPVHAVHATARPAKPSIPVDDSPQGRAVHAKTRRRRRAKSAPPTDEEKDDENSEEAKFDASDGRSNVNAIVQKPVPRG